MELRGSSESGFILRYKSAAGGATEGKEFVFIIDEFYLSILRLRPIEKIRSNLHKILNQKIEYPILNIKLTEHILIRGSTDYELDNCFGSEYLQPQHFFICLQPEDIWSGKLNKPETNPYRFGTCDLSQYSFRHGDYKLPSSLFSSSGMNELMNE